jgi:hypothetical protein
MGKAYFVVMHHVEQSRRWLGVALISQPQAIAHRSLLALPNFEIEVHRKPLSQIQSHRLIAAQESQDSRPIHAGFTLQPVVRNSAIGNRTPKEIGYRRFLFMGLHGAYQHGTNARKQRLVNITGNRESKNPRDRGAVEWFLIRVVKRSRHRAYPS